MGICLHGETKVGLLYALKCFTEHVTRDMLLPVKRQSRDESDPEPRAAGVYMARLPELESYARKAPFILHQVVTGLDEVGSNGTGTGAKARKELQSNAVVRSVFCVYHPDEQEGGLALLNLMEEMRIELLRHPILGSIFELDLREGVSQAIYPETGERGTAPFYLGEMVTTWKLPPVHRIDAERVIQGLPPIDPGMRFRGAGETATTKKNGKDENHDKAEH